MSIDPETYIALFRGNLVPLYVVLSAATWLFYDSFMTLEDEIRYIWPQRRCVGKFMYLWIRYYSIALLIFDVAQIHMFARPGVASDTLCVAMDPTTRIAGAISLWSVELIMQLRVYVLFKCSNRIAIINGVLFVSSIVGFCWILAHNATTRRGKIADAIHLPLLGCPVINSGLEWAQWVPATLYEGVLFGFALYKTCASAMRISRNAPRVSLYSLILRDNLLYFFGVACLLISNNLMVVGITHIPWFSFGPFHAAVGILTTRMLLNFRKASLTDADNGGTMNFWGPSGKNTLEITSPGVLAFRSFGSDLVTDTDLEARAGPEVIQKE